GRAEGREVRLSQVVLEGARVEAVALRLGAAVDCVVLRRGYDLPVLRVVALQAAHEGDAHARGQVRVFAVCLLPAAPARVSEDVYVRRPECETLITLALSAPDELVMLRASLGRDNVGDLAHELRVPS